MPPPLLILNAVAGADRGSVENPQEKIMETLAAGGIFPQVALTSPTCPARQIARGAVAEDRPLVLAAGGDGTVSEVATELVGHKAVLGILPVGTFNNIARSLGIAPSIAEACSVVCGGCVRPIDVGVANELDIFFEAAGVGLDATLFPIGEEIKGGRWTRMFEAARLALQYRRMPVVLTFSESLAEAAASAPRGRRRQRRASMRRQIRRRALLTVVANGPYYGGGFAVAPSARLNDGRLTVTIYRRFSKLDLLRHFWAISRGRHSPSPKVEIFHSREVLVDAPTPLPVHVDGRPLGHTPVRLRTLPGALRVLVAQEGKTADGKGGPVAFPVAERNSLR